MIYIATRRSLWNVTRTTLEFAATTLGLGLACVGIIEPGSSGAGLLLLGAFIAGLGLLAKFLDRERARQTRLSSSEDWQDFSKRSGRLLSNQLSNAWNATWMTWLGAVFVSLTLYLGVAPIAVLPMLGVTAIVQLFVSQFINRWLYFASIVTYRMPGAST
jgi:DMSO reductase anchor subunit